MYEWILFYCLIHLTDLCLHSTASLKSLIFIAPSQSKADFAPLSIHTFIPRKNIALVMLLKACLPPFGEKEERVSPEAQECAGNNATRRKTKGLKKQQSPNLRPIVVVMKSHDTNQLQMTELLCSLGSPWGASKHSQSWENWPTTWWWSWKIFVAVSASWSDATIIV